MPRILLEWTSYSGVRGKKKRHIVIRFFKIPDFSLKNIKFPTN